MKRKIKIERSDCRVLFSAVTNIRLHRERGREGGMGKRGLRVVGEMSTPMCICHLQLSVDAGVPDADDTLLRSFCYQETFTRI